MEPSLVELWHAYFEAGCYEGGVCPHRRYEALVHSYKCRALRKYALRTGKLSAEGAERLIEELERSREAECERIDRLTDDNRIGDWNRLEEEIGW